ncbi:hypothetical protein DSM3645_17885 [Blastopirellula marina DSM 3645]|uniref:Uncharacterized protein n=1 Tax=Blastopirellula marina DSM 3645 TaxID=314230 RepID=A3ZNZ9_9BACT|nr:hypothetical protein DSM3645_17885 [Blastopirellula marina DSM 3645]
MGLLEWVVGSGPSLGGVEIWPREFESVRRCYFLDIIEQSRRMRGVLRWAKSQLSASLFR